jgi:hypothetical protein
METEYEPAGPKPIKQLSKDVINQIAAAEVYPIPSTIHSTNDRSSIDQQMQSRN